MVRLKSPPGRRDREQDGDENGFLGEQNYIQALGADSMEGERSIVSLGLFYCHQIVMTEVCHVTWLCRWWWWDVQSCWILHFHISESQTWTQHGSDRWAPPSSLSLIVKKHFFLKFIIYLFCLSFTASEFARTPAKTVTFGAAPDIEPSTPTRTGRGELCAFSVLLLFSLSRKCTQTFTVRVSSTRPEEWKQDSTESTYKNVDLKYLNELAASQQL